MNKVNRKEILDRFKECKTPLEYEKYEKYYFGDNGHKGQQWLFRFENNYGASVIKRYGSYGFEDDLFELAVIKFDKPSKLYGSWHFTYDTSITSDVIGYLTNNDVLRYLIKIQRLDENGR